MTRLPDRALLLAIFSTLLLTPGANAAVVTTVECGALRDYTAPNPGGPTPGGITFGFTGGSPEVIAADAVITPPADTVIPSLSGTAAPTCLSVDRDAGVITALAFAASGTLSGPIVFTPDLSGPGQDGYVIAGRLVTPAAALAGNDSLTALIKAPADAGSTISIVFNVDVSTGFPTSFTATSTISGAVTLLPSGDVQVGAATLPAGVVEATSLAALTQAHSLGVPATVQIQGVGTPTGSGVDIAITLSVTFVPPATPTPTPSASAQTLPNTATSAPAPANREPNAWPLILALVAAIAATATVHRRPR